MTTPTPTDTDLLRRIRDDIAILTVPTLAPTEPTNRSARRSVVTRPPLISGLRDAIRPNQGGTGKGSSSGSRLPLDAAAVDLYWKVAEIARQMFEQVVLGERPSGTPEQLLIEWSKVLEVDFHRGEVSRRQLEVQQQRLETLRARIEDMFDPPSTGDIPFCPRCGFTHYLARGDDGEVKQRRCVQVTYRLARLRANTEPAVARCGRPECDGRWEGRLTARNELVFPRYDSELEENIERNGELQAGFIVDDTIPGADEDEL